MRCQSQGFYRILSWYTGNFKEYPARFDYCYPMVRAGFPPAHTSFGGLFADRLVRENSNPHLSAPPEATGDSHSGRLNLAGCNPVGPQGLKPKFAEVYRGTRGGCSFAPATDDLPVFGSLRL